MVKNKVLIIRFSSFGDIVQCSSIVDIIRRNMPNAQIDWVTRSEFSELVRLNQEVNRVVVLNKKDGIKGLWLLFKRLRDENYEVVYDAHNNLRSSLIHLLFYLSFSKSKWIVRSKNRFKRILLFKFRINLLPNPFKGIDSFVDPLKDIFKDNSLYTKMVHYNFSSEAEVKVKENLNLNKKIITIVPSAAWPMKRWPLEHWKKLVQISSEFDFYILGGKEDTFCEEIKAVDPLRIFNLAGKLSLIESCCFIKNSNFVISADTGLLHVADVLGIKGIALTGPTAFGYTKSSLIKNLEVELLCRPCSKDGRGKCSQSVYQKCMVDLGPELVNNKLKEYIHS